MISAYLRKGNTAVVRQLIFLRSPEQGTPYLPSYGFPNEFKSKGRIAGFCIRLHNCVY